eukprot:SAG22_NODE_1579_length_4066_cov_7.513486_2_plen_466_part_00
MALHSLPLTYAGYGVIGGIGIGIGYVVPIGGLLRWFPDRRGLAAGLGTLGFGGGAMLAAPANEALMAGFRVAPTYLGPVGAVEVALEGGRRVAMPAGGGGGGAAEEVVVATAADVASWGGELAEGVYLVGTGDTGVAATFLTLGGGYALLMSAAAFGFRTPAPGWVPAATAAAAPAAAPAQPEPAEQRRELAGEGQQDPRRNAAAKPERLLAETEDVHVDDVHKTPQFWLLWAATAGNALGGIIILSSAKLMMTVRPCPACVVIYCRLIHHVTCTHRSGSTAVSFFAALCLIVAVCPPACPPARPPARRLRCRQDIFGTTMPTLVDSSFAAGYVSALSLANMSGRLGWASFSDLLGRKPTTLVFASLGLPACLAVPQLTALAAADPTAVAPLVGFCGSTMVMITMYGGVYALLPAYAADIFGQKHVTAIFGRLMTAAPVAALCGPLLLTNLRAQAHADQARQLAR